MKIVSSVSTDQRELLRDIATMFCNGQFDCDPTYSIGNFYKGDVPEPRLKFDLTPQAEGVVQADSRSLPVESNSLKSIMFDPPFVAASPPKETTGIIKDRFSYMLTIKELWSYYKDSLQEFHRVLVPYGVLVFKCQDVVHGRRNWFSHCEVMNLAVLCGFYPRDLFVLVANNRIIRDNMKEQQHARKYHSYFWVFEKKPCTIPYSAVAALPEAA